MECSRAKLLREHIAVPLDQFVSDMMDVINSSFPQVRKRTVRRYCRTMFQRELPQFVESTVRNESLAGCSPTQPIKGIAHLILTDMMMKTRRFLVSDKYDRAQPSWIEDVLDALRLAAGDIPESYVPWGVRMHNSLADGEYVFQIINHRLDVPIDNQELFAKQQALIRMVGRSWWWPV